jgi:dihydrofolate reductase
MISIIVAVAHGGVIGVKNDLPWHLPADLQHFKNLTTNHAVVMGYNTYKSIVSRIGKHLPNRRNIVLSDDPNFKADDVTVAYSLDEALQNSGDDELFVIGGASVYQQALVLADRLYITEIDLDIKGDAFFPSIDKAIWKEVSREEHQKDDKNPHDYDFVVYERVR